MNEPSAPPISVHVMNKEPFLPVTVVDVDIKFMTMFGLMVKFAILLVPFGVAVGFVLGVMAAMATKH